MHSLKTPESPQAKTHDGGKAGRERLWHSLKTEPPLTALGAGSTEREQFH